MILPRILRLRFVIHVCGFCSGWGKTDGSYLGEKADVLMEGQLPLMSNRDSAQKNRFKGKPLINHNMVFGGSEDKILSIGQGDSGGPYVCMNSQKQFVSIVCLI